MEGKRKIDLLKVASSGESEALEACLAAEGGEASESAFPKAAFQASGNLAMTYARIRVPAEESS